MQLLLHWNILILYSAVVSSFKTQQQPLVSVPHHEQDWSQHWCAHNPTHEAVGWLMNCEDVRDRVQVSPSVLTPPLSTITHPFVVFERPSEAHGLDELGEGPNLLLCVLGRLFHIVELTDDKWKSSERRMTEEVKNRVRGKNRTEKEERKKD